MSRAAAARFTGLATAAIVAVATVSPAPALASDGETILKLNGPAAGSLRSQGVKISAVAPARGGAKRLVLPIGAGLAGEKTTVLRHRGAIALRAGGEVLRLSGLRLMLGERAKVEAEVGGEQVNLFRVLRGGRRQVDAETGEVDLARLRLKLTKAGAREIVERLDLKRLRPQRFGKLSAAVAGLTAAGGESASEGASQSTSCPLPSSAGPDPEEPLPEMARTAGAVDVSSATIDWHVRESFIRYIATGEGTSVSGGASADPPEVRSGTSAALSYGFHFPFADGWLDAGADPTATADDTALLAYSGAVRFLYSGHEIDLTTADPEIEIAGSKSRLIFAISDSGGAAQRQVLVNLDLGRAAGISASGNNYTYERVPGAIPAGTASSTFAGFYSPGTDFGCVTVSFTTSG